MPQPTANCATDASHESRESQAHASGCRRLEHQIEQDACKSLTRAVSVTQRKLILGRPAPGIDHHIVSQDLYDLFGMDRLDWMCDEFIAAAHTCGLAVMDDEGEIRPDVLDAVTVAIMRGVWFGLTEAHVGIMECTYIPCRMLTFT